MGSEYARVAKCLFGGQLESFEEDGCSVGLEDCIMSRDTQMVGESKMSSHLPEIQASLPSMSSVDRGPAPQSIITTVGSKSTSTPCTPSVRSSTSISEFPGHLGLVKLLCMGQSMSLKRSVSRVMSTQITTKYKIYQNCYLITPRE